MMTQSAPWLVRFGGWIIAIFLILPFLAVIPVSFTDQVYLSLPKSGLSVAHYQKLLGDPTWSHAFFTSFWLALASACTAVLLGTGCAISSWQIGGRPAQAMRFLVILPLIIPTIVQALSLYRTWADIGILDSYTGIIIAHGVTGMPFVFIAVSSVLINLDRRLMMASQSLGASPAQTLNWVILPLLASGILSGALFAFVHSFDEAVIILFITSFGVETLPKKIWSTLRDDLTPVVACVSVLMGLATFVVILIASNFKREANN